MSIHFSGRLSPQLTTFTRQYDLGQRVELDIPIPTGDPEYGNLSFRTVRDDCGHPLLGSDPNQEVRRTVGTIIHHMLSANSSIPLDEGPNAPYGAILAAPDTFELSAERMPNGEHGEIVFRLTDGSTPVFEMDVPLPDPIEFSDHPGRYQGYWQDVVIPKIRALNDAIRGVEAHT